MCSVPADVPVADRARWLAELSYALNEAARILFELDVSASRPLDLGDLYTRIEAARFQVQTLQLSRSLNPRPEESPKRIKFEPWQPNSTEFC